MCSPENGQAHTEESVAKEHYKNNIPGAMLQSKNAKQTCSMKMKKARKREIRANTKKKIE